MVKYTILHDGCVLYTLQSNDPQTESNMFNMMLKLTDESTGVFSLFRIEIDPETGREKHTQVATAKDGIEI